jgi:hypothetical protein
MKSFAPRYNSYSMFCPHGEFGNLATTGRNDSIEHFRTGWDPESAFTKARFQSNCWKPLLITRLYLLAVQSGRAPVPAGESGQGQSLPDDHPGRTKLHSIVHSQ